MQYSIKYIAIFEKTGYNETIKNGKEARDMSIGEEMKKIMLAGIGAVAVTAEKSKEMVDMLVKKGELTVEQGKVLNEELKHNIDDAIKKSKAEASPKENLDEKLSSMTPEELAKLKAKIDSLQQDG
jgi:polyhydroxyalkanoate synthesis regulator phasin